MSLSDPIADMLTKVRNAKMVKYEKVDIPDSKMKYEIIKTIKDEGYIKNFKRISHEGKSIIRIFLKYNENMDNVINGMKRISKPSRRVYRGYKNLPRIYNGLGILIVSTSIGVITGKEAKQKKLGGELICSMW